MPSAQIHERRSNSNDEEDYAFALQIATSSMMPMIMHAAVQLDVFGIIARAGPGAKLSAKYIADQLPTQVPSTPFILDRVLRFLASFSVLNSSLLATEDGLTQRVYGLTSASKFFVPNEDGASLAPLMMLIHDKVYTDMGMHLKDAIIDGGIPFTKAHEMHVFEYTKIDSRFNHVFNNAMFNHTTIIMNKILETYKGFQEVEKVVDVGGGVGTAIGLITAKYPTIKGINFDLPHVVQNAPVRPGVEHVGGDMFEIIPNSESIFMKWILHDWDDERCVVILKNCKKALPENGKAIVVELVVPAQLESTDTTTRNTFQWDLAMWTNNSGSKERSYEEFKLLAKEAGFARIEKVCFTYNFWVMEFCKK